MESKPSFDLEDRTAALSREVVLLIKPLRITVLNKNTIEQLIRSVTSIAANYMEANEAESRKDFAHKVSICKKEAKETIYWLGMLVLAEERLSAKIVSLIGETEQLIKIFQTMIGKVRSSM